MSTRAGNRTNPVASRRAPVTARGEDKRARIIEAAGQLLAEQGYAGTTLADIAKAAGTFAGSLYYHFESREELAIEVLTQGVDIAIAHTSAAVEALPADAAARRRLETAIRAHVESILHRSPAALAAARAIGQLPPAVATPVSAAFREYGRIFADLFAAAEAEGSIDPSVDLSAVRMLVVGAANWSAEWFDPEGRSSVDDVADLLCRMIFDGLGPAGSAGGAAELA
ncbi:MAG: TetR/AcrR family transcriptional regulator [Acidimicrobiales bacterium]